MKFTNSIIMLVGMMAASSMDSASALRLSTTYRPVKEVRSSDPTPQKVAVVETDEDFQCSMDSI